MSQSAPLELTILMPCLNEAETLATCIRKAQGYLEARAVRGEVLIADNGSTDGSQAIALALGARVVDVPTRGYGAALMAGIEDSSAEFVIMGDSDDSYDFSALDPFLEELRAGHDLVMGNRFRGGIEPGAMPALHRYLGNPVLSFVGRILFESRIRDFHCGLRGVRRTSALAMDMQSTGMEFASEMVVKATLFRFRISEVPTRLSPDGRTRPPHLRSWSDGWRHLRFLLMFSPRWVFFYPGLVLMCVSFTMGATLLIGPVDIGFATLEVNTLVVCGGAMLVGYQCVWFAVLTKAFASREGLLPNDVRVERFRTSFPLEKALLLSVAATLIGLAGLAKAVIQWDLGPLDPSQSLRLVVPSLTLAMGGIQTATGSILLSILALPSARPPAPIDLRDRADAKPELPVPA